MASIVTNKFHVHSAKQFIESFSETSKDIYYMFIGRPTPWSGDDSTPTTPDDSVANAAFGMWNDMVSAIRIQPTDTSFVCPYVTWTANGQYAMYDHRVSMTDAIANSSNPMFVLTSAGHVFKCIFNGKVNASAQISKSTTEPTVVGQADVTTLTYSAGETGDYAWKYLFTMGSEETSFRTSQFMPVSAADSVLNANGDVSDDLSDRYTVFNAARTSGNGAIYRVVVDTQGANYNNAPTVVITGDGSGASATATVAANQISAINMASYGEDYSWATVSLIPNDGNSNPSITTATATAVISPRASFTNSTGTFYKTNHGINLPEELGARYVMLHVNFDGTGDDDLLAAGNDYRRVGIIRNPHVYGTTTIANASIYSQTTDLTMSDASNTTFAKDELVWQESSNAYGVCIEVVGSVLKLVNVRGTFEVGETILGIGNGEANGYVMSADVTIPSLPEAFTPVLASGATATISAIALPDLQPFSGDVIFADQRAKITRATDQVEVVRVILAF